MKEIGTHAATFGAKLALVTGGQKALAVAEETIRLSLDEKGISCHVEPFGGECSQAEIDRLVEVARSIGANMVISAGGGKVIDTGKAVAYALQVPVIVVPTIAATDAPCSALSVIYTEDGVFERYLVLPKNPEVVLVDTQVVAQAPAYYLVSGMGDALATFWEADTCNKSAKPNVLTGGSPPTRSAMALARLCYDTLLEFGVEAKLAVENGVVTQAVEAVVEANTLLSGLGFESGGLAGSHSVHNGLTVLESSHGALHGQKVAFGVITQMVLEGRPKDHLYEVLDFCMSVGLPICLEDCGVVNPSREDIRKVAEATTAEGETIHATWFPVTADMVEAAIIAADAIGRAYKKGGRP